MKQSILSIFVVIVALASCDTALQTYLSNSKLEKIVFQIANKEAQTCTAISTEVNRYIMEVYDHNGDNVNCFPYGDSPTASNHAESTNGEFIASLDKRKTYNILFWADNGIAYTTSNLKEISLADNQTMSEHTYYAKKGGKIVSLNNIYLKRALAKINFIQKASNTDLDTKDISIKYDKNYKFNCYDGSISPLSNTRVRSFTISNTTLTDGTILGTDYHFANTTSGKDSTFIHLIINLKSISNIPINANKVTNIMGEYSTNAQSSEFTFNQLDEWNIPKN